MNELRRLTGVDAAFLYMETPTQLMQICAVLILDPSTMEHEYSFENIKRMLHSKVHEIPIFYERLRRYPLNLEHPLWVTDENFDIDDHVRHIGVPSPGGPEQLNRLVAEISSVPLNRSRPLWEVWVIEGLENGRVALAIKLHHAAGDGVSIGYLVRQFLSPEPDTPVLDAPINDPPPAPELPGTAGLLADVVRKRIKDPSRFFTQARDTLSRAASLVRRTIEEGTQNFSPGLPFMAPRVMFNRSLTSRRQVALGDTSLADYKFIKNVYGCKLNDVVLAVSTQAIRRYLIEFDDLPTQALLASCPVSVRHDHQAGDYGNRVSTLFARLPVHVTDPVEQLRVVMLDTRDAKYLQSAMGSELLTDWAELAAPGMFTTAMRMYSSMGLAEKHPPIHNLVVSNIPGPRSDLYCLGARVEAFFPLGPVLEGAALNITLISQKDRMGVGIISCPDIVPEIDRLIPYYKESLACLKQRAEAEAEAGS